MIRTARLLLRPLVAADAEPLFAYRTDPHVAAMQGWNATSRADADAFVATFGGLPFPRAGGWAQIGIVESRSGTLIGDIGAALDEDGETAEIGYTIAPAFQRRGYGVEAVSGVLDFLARDHRVRAFIARTLPENVASRALLGRLGFREERSGPGEVSFALSLAGTAPAGAKHPVMIATADLVDAHADRLQSCLLQFRSFGAHAAFHGPIRTVATREDNALVKELLSTPGEGAVLVIDGGGSLACALVGDVIAGLAVANGWSGLVINAAVRDVAALRALPIGIKALGSNPRKSAKERAGAIDLPVWFGGVRFVPGAFLYADEDGIVVADAALA